MWRAFCDICQHNAPHPEADKQHDNGTSLAKVPVAAASKHPADQHCQSDDQTESSVLNGMTPHGIGFYQCQSDVRQKAIEWRKDASGNSQKRQDVCEQQTFHEPTSIPCSGS